MTAPIIFVAVGGLFAASGLVDAPSVAQTLKPLVEVTLVWVLFSDAAGVAFGQMRHDLGRIVRLLGIGLPLTVVAGWALAQWLFPSQGIWLTLLVAAALAPTDAALGLPVVMNPAVPSRVRRLITVESGLNDGIVTPVRTGRRGIGRGVGKRARSAGRVGRTGDRGGRRRRRRPRRWIRLAVVTPPGDGPRMN